MLNLLNNLSLGLFNNGGGSSTPAFSLFDHDASTYFWDFKTDIANADYVDENADDTLVFSPEVIGNRGSFVQNNKYYQPLVDGEDGINFEGGTDCLMSLTRPTITNGKEGLFIACNAYKSAAGIYLFCISKNGGTTNSRLQFQVAGNNQLGVVADEADGGSPNWLAYGQTLTNDTWYTLAAEIIADGATASPCTLWVNGSEITYDYRDTNTFAAFPSSNPSYVTLGNDTTTNFSYNGGISELVYQDGLASLDMKTSIMDYLISVRPS